MHVDKMRYEHCSRLPSHVPGTRYDTDILPVTPAGSVLAKTIPGILHGTISAGPAGAEHPGPYTINPGSRLRAPSDSGLNTTSSLAETWPIFHSCALAMVQGQTKPPMLGPSNISATGMSPAPWHKAKPLAMS